MGPRSVRLAALLGVLLLPVACGGDAGRISAGSGPETTAAEGDVTVDAAVCDALGAEEPPENLGELLPAEFGPAAEVVESFAALGGSTDGGADAAAVERLADALGADGAGDALIRLGDALAAGCGDEQIPLVFGQLGGAAELVAVERDDDYCAALEPALGPGSSAQDDARLRAAIEVAPAAHRDALERVEGLLADDSPPADEAGLVEVASSFIGIGLYAEARCGIADAFAQMMIGVAFLGLGPSSGGSAGSEGADRSGAGTAVEPEAADPSGAAAAVPAALDVAFGAVRVDLEEDGKYLASVVAPEGWVRNTSFNVTFDPPEGAGFGFLTSLEVGAGCDGVCEATDWESRVRGPEGYLTSRLEGWSVTEDRAPEGSAGAVITASQEDGSALVVVLRWDDAADRYFQCVADLASEDAALAPAMLAACEASRPGWIAVG